MKKEKVRKIICISTNIVYCGLIQTLFPLGGCGNRYFVIFCNRNKIECWVAMWCDQQFKTLVKILWWPHTTDLLKKICTICIITLLRAHLLHIKKKNIIYKRNYLKQLNILSPWVFLGFSLYQYITMHYSHYKHFLMNMC
jgi:hypothetical protein